MSYADKPTPPGGYKICTQAPLNVYQAHSAQPSSMPYWEYETWEEMGTDVLYYKLIGNAGEVYWEYPTDIACGSAKVPGGTGGVDSKKIKQLQAALNEYYDLHPYYPLNVDGVFGPKTCAAAYGYQQDFLGSDSVLLTEKLFTTLDLPAWYSGKFEMSCTPYFTSSGDPKPTPTPSPTPGPEPVPIPVEASSGFPWLAVLLGTATGSVVGLAAEKKRLVGVRRAPAMGIGAVLGGLGGFLAGKLGG